MKPAKLLAQHISMSKVCLISCTFMVNIYDLIDESTSVCMCVWLPISNLCIAPAKFVKRLNDYSIEKGKALILEGTYTGTPAISVTWKKNGINIAPSQRCNITTTEKSSILEIPSTTVEDAGQYNCYIENASGKDSCSAQIQILGLLWLFIPTFIYK